MIAPSPPALPAPPPPPPPRPRPSRPGPVVLGVALVASFALVVVLGVSPATNDHASRREAYAFMGTSPDGEPTRWDPCSPIRYQVDLAGQPASVLPDIHEAVRRTAEASGIRFEFEGVIVGTSPIELVQRVGFVSSPADGLFRWSPVLITFAPTETFRTLGAPPNAVGVGLPVTSRNDADQYVSGLVMVNTDVPLAAGFEHAASLGPIVQHELGHVVGLGHVFHPAQLMYPAPIVPDWNDGDIAGLRRLGSGPCLVVPSAFPNAAALVPTR